MSKALIISLSFFMLLGCQTHKLPMPKGKWTAVNQDGFIPPNIVKYSDNVEDMPLDVDIQLDQNRTE